MRCRDARVALSARLDGELGERDVIHLDAHIKGCPSCRDEQRRYDRVRSELRLGEPSAVDLVPKLRVPLPPTTTRRRARRPRTSGFAIAAAAAVVVASVFVTRAVDGPT